MAKMSLEYPLIHPPVRRYNPASYPNSIIPPDRRTRETQTPTSSDDSPADTLYQSLLTASGPREPSPVVFRVHTSSSISSLVHSSESGMSGFFAPSPYMHISEAQYNDRFGHLSDEGWSCGQGLAPSMVAHLLDRPVDQMHLKTHEVDWQVVKDADKSPWVSTTRNLDWTIWEIARRLAKGEKEVRLAVIKQSVAVELETRPHMQEKEKCRARGGEVWTVPVGEIYDTQPHAAYGQRPSWNRARLRALARDEVLYYGRIFDTSIVGDFVWTRNVSIEMLGNVASDGDTL